MSPNVQLRWTMTTIGWVTTTICYFFVLIASRSLYQRMFDQPPDHNWDRSGMLIGSFLLVVPYLFAGLYARLAFAEPVRGAFWVSIVPMVAERCLIYLIGVWLVALGGDGSMEGITTMMFIRGEAAPFYSLPYIVLGPLSVLIAMITAMITARIGRPMAE